MSARKAAMRTPRGQASAAPEVGASGEPSVPGARIAPRPKLELRPRSVYCVIGRRYQDLHEADSICAGRFTHAGRTLALGVPPDWHSPDLPGDEEWQIEWWKFYGGLHLAHAFSVRGERRYLDTWLALVGSFAEQVAVGRDTSDVAGRRIQNWIYAWDRFSRAPGFPGLGADNARRLVASLAEQVAWLRRNLSRERNHRTLELYALFVAALALPALDPEGELLGFSLAALEENALTDVLPDGVHRERSTHYHMIVLRSLVGVLENARRFGLALSEAFVSRVSRACEFAMHAHRPDGEIPALSDSDGGSYLDVLALAARHLDRDDLRYGASRGAGRAMPASRHVSFPVGGYHVQRTPWDAPPESTRFAIFDCGPVGDGGHGHYDALSLELFAAGRPLLVDPGRYTYAESEPGSRVNWRRAFKGTAAHNTVCVDGRDQTPYRRGKPRAGAASTTFAGRWTTPGLDVMGGAVTSPAYPAVHRRRVIFVADSWWIVEDSLASSEAHVYDVRWHLAPEVSEAVVLDAEGTGATLAAGAALVHVDGPGRAALEQGWVSRMYGVREPAPVLSVKTPRVARAHVVTVVAPEGGPAPRVVRRGDPDAPAACLVERVLPDRDGTAGRGRDLVAWAARPTWLELGPVRVLARHAWARLDPHGAIVAFEAHDAAAVRLAGAGTTGCAMRALPPGPLVWCAARQRFERTPGGDAS